MAKLPSVVSNLAPDLRAFVNRVREALDGKGNDKLVTVNDLISSGIAVPGPGGTIIPPGGGVITTPPTPKNVAANGAIQNIIVTWDDPLYFGHAYAEVWGADTDNLGEAVQIGMAPGAIFIDAIGPSSIRYYWVRFVNTLGTAGAFNAVDGVRGETGADVEYLLETLTGAITETQLFSSLGARINNIEANTTAIQTEATARVNADNSLFAQYSVKIDTNGYVSGFGLSSTANNATPFSEFIIRADRFSVASPSGPGITPVIPFIVTTTEQIINGVTVPVGVYINGAFIQNGTITNAKIGNAAIDDAKIASLSAGKITAGSISVGSFIQSSNYLIGSQGWKIHGDGTAEFAAASIRGQLTAGQINSNGLSIRDTAGNVILNAGTGDFTGKLNGTAASTVVSNASTALTTANTAQSTADSASTTASSALTTANSASSAASTAQSTANSALAGLNNKISNDARNVLSGSGGIAIGSLNWDTSGNRTSGFGIGITRAGIAAFNSSGGATFILNGGDGSASFSGTLSAAGGTFAGTLTAQAVNAVSTINIAGESVVTMDQFVTVKYTNGGNNTGTTVYTGTFNMASAGNVFFSCVSKFESNSPAADVSQITLGVGGSAYFAAGRDLLSQSVKVISAKAYFGAGPQTFEVQHTYQNIEATDVLYVTTITLMKGYR